MCSSYHQFVLVNEAVLVVVPELPELQPCAVPVGHVEAVSVAVHVLHELRQGQLPVPVLKHTIHRHRIWQDFVLTVSRSAIVSSLLTLYMWW